MKKPNKRKPKIADLHLIGKTAGAVLKTFHAAHGDMTVDRLLTNPSIAIELCKATNARLGRQLKHEEILKALLNARKRGDLKP